MGYLGLGGEVSTQQWPCFLGQEVNLLKLESSYSSTDIQMYQKKTYSSSSKQIHWPLFKTITVIIYNYQWFSTKVDWFPSWASDDRNKSEPSIAIMAGW